MLHRQAAYSGNRLNGKLLDFMSDQSLLTRAERSRVDGQPHLAHWSTPFLVLLMKTLAFPFENRTLAIGVVAILLFTPLF